MELILDWGMEGAPREVCGIVRLRPRGYQVLQLRNDAADPTVSYRLLPSTLGDVLPNEQAFYCETTIWHTHPGGHIGPSSGDLDNLVPGAHYFVMTLPSGEVKHFGALPIM